MCNGRPNRLYEHNEESIELSFPYRDYKLLSSITLEAIAKLGNAGKSILYNVGKEYGQEMINKLKITKDKDILSRLEKINLDRKSTRLNSSHVAISYAVFCLKKKK